MTSVRSPRGPFSVRGGRRAGGDPPGPPPEIAALLDRRGWAVVEQEAGRGGAAARRWVASAADGTRWDIGLVPVPEAASQRAVLVERLDRLRSLDHEHLARVVDLVEAAPGLLAVISRRPQGEDLPFLMGCRGPLEAGEAVTLLVPVARALAVLHAAGLSYGGVEAPDLIVGSDGRPVLRAPLDLCAQPAPDDVRSLAEVVASVLSVDGPAEVGDVDSPTARRDPGLDALRAELAAARRGDPGSRPEVGTLAALCHEAAAPTPIALPDAARLAAAAISARRADEPAPGRGGAAGAVGAGAGAGVPEPRDRRGTTGQSTARARRPRGGDRDPVEGRGLARRVSERGRAPRREQGAERRGALSGGLRHPVARAGLVLVACAALSVGGVLVRAHLVAGAEAASGPGAGTRQADAERAIEEQSLERPEVDATRRGDAPAAAGAELTERRIELLTGDRPPVDVLAPGSPAEALDVQLLDDLRRAGLTIEGARATVAQARAASPEPAGGEEREPGEEIQVEVTYTISEHIQRAGDGSTTDVPANGPSTARLTLRWTDLGWRVSEVA